MENIDYESIQAALDHLDGDSLRSQLLDLLIYDQSVIYRNVQPDERKLINQILTPKELSDIYDVLDVPVAEINELLAEMTPQQAASVLAEMYTDNVVDLLSGMPKTDLSTYLNLLPSTQRKTIQQLLRFPNQTAGAIMTTEFVTVNHYLTGAQALEVVKGRAESAEVIYYVYVVDEAETLVGVVTIRQLMLAAPHETVAQLMTRNLYVVHVDDDQEMVARKVKEYNFLAVPVVTHDGHVIGIITVDDIIDVIEEETTEDYSGLAGVDVNDPEKSPFKSAAHRLPWLLTLLFLGMSTASLISHFEGLVSQASILAVFISLITGTAGNAGTQSLAIAVRQISYHDQHKLWPLIKNELLTGIIVGVVAAVVITIVVDIWKHSLILGGVVGISMAAAISVANMAGSLIPILMDKIGVDPAVASGPFISTLSDLTSVLIYFSIAGAFLSAIQ